MFSSWCSTFAVSSRSKEAGRCWIFRILWRVVFPAHLLNPWCIAQNSPLDVHYGPVECTPEGAEMAFLQGLRTSSKILNTSCLNESPWRSSRKHLAERTMIPHSGLLENASGATFSTVIVFFCFSGICRDWTLCLPAVGIPKFKRSCEGPRSSSKWACSRPIGATLFCTYGCS